MHLPCYRRVTARGVAPRQPVEPLYEYYWLYGAVVPATGADLFLEMPTLDADCFSAFLRELARAYPESFCVVVLDNAPAHVARRVRVPENIALLHLPPYSPELNPVERLWLALRQRIDVFDQAVRSSLLALREHVAEIVRSFTPEQLRHLTGYSYVLDAVHAL